MSEATEQPLLAPDRVAERSVSALIETLESMVGVEYSPKGALHTVESVENQVGTTLGFSFGGGGWTLAMICGRPEAEALTKEVFAMEEDEEVTGDDLADALGEVINILAGFVKEAFLGDAPDLVFGLPIFVEGRTWLEHISRKVTTMGQWVAQDDMSYGMLVCWNAEKRKR